MAKTIFLRDDENFKLKFGKSNNNWESVVLDQDTINNRKDDIKDGIFVAEDEATGKYHIAKDGEFPAYPVLEYKYNFSSEEFGGVTISVGSVQAFIKTFNGTPAKGDKLKVVDGVLSPIDTANGDTEDMAVAVVNGNHGTYLEITKLY